MDTPNTDAVPESQGFGPLCLEPAVLSAVEASGYAEPTPVQAQTIPPMLAGRDVLSQAQTGTGKTAAFALPLLSRIDVSNPKPQVLVLAPTRELAIQVAKSFSTYGKYLPRLKVAAVYGGADMRGQLRQLKAGVHVVVGTPGRLMDHMRRGSLDFSDLRCIVLDEADEMLRMGFIEDVEWVLEQCPDERQLALFSATMPPQVRKIANRFLRDPQLVAIQKRSAPAETIRQRACIVTGYRKLETLTRILEAEDIDAVLIFVRTRAATTELAEGLSARGYPCAALNGDIPQALRERIIDRLKTGGLDVVIGTDVAARGLDVPRISHVVNYDLPNDVETYVHRIGRTGRAGRKGEAISLASTRERHILRNIEQSTKARVYPMDIPDAKVINERRIGRFKERIQARIAKGGLEIFDDLLKQFTEENEVDPMQAASALAALLQGDQPLLLKNEPMRKPRPSAKPRPASRSRPGANARPGARSRASAKPAYDSKTGASAKPAYESKTEASAKPAYESKTEASAKPAYESKTGASAKPAYESKTEASAKPAYESKTGASAKPRYESKTKASAKPRYESKTKPVSAESWSGYGASNSAGPKAASSAPGGKPSAGSTHSKAPAWPTTVRKAQPTAKSETRDDSSEAPSKPRAAANARRSGGSQPPRSKRLRKGPSAGKKRPARAGGPVKSSKDKGKRRVGKSGS